MSLKLNLVHLRVAVLLHQMLALAHACHGQLLVGPTFAAFVQPIVTFFDGPRKRHNQFGVTIVGADKVIAFHRPTLHVLDATIDELRVAGEPAV